MVSQIVRLHFVDLTIRFLVAQEESHKSVGLLMYSDSCLARVSQPIPICVLALGVCTKKRLRAKIRMV